MNLEIALVSMASLVDEAKVSSELKEKAIVGGDEASVKKEAAEENLTTTTLTVGKNVLNNNEI